jgi:sugar lactone lactonase YvrE
MMRFTVRFAASLLTLIALASCSDYSPPSSVPDPPDTTFEDGLWTASGIQPGIFRLTSAQLQAGDSVIPATTITTNSAALTGFNSLAFDADGTLWMTSQSDSQLVAFSRSALATSGLRVASRLITSADGSLDAPSALAFDASHALWVANTSNGTIVRYDAAQLAAGGRLTPSVILSGVGQPTGLAFDAAGGLWFSDGGGHRVAKFGASQLAASGFILPQVVLTSRGPDITNPVGLAFDKAGNLWIANSGLSNVVALNANHLATTGLVNADVVLASSSTFPQLPLGLAFDDQENLWVVYAEGLLARYDHAAIAVSGDPTPAVRLIIPDHVVFRSLAFWPRPAGLPVN